MIRDEQLRNRLNRTTDLTELDQLAERLIASAENDRAPLESGWTNSPYSISKLMLNALVRIYAVKSSSILINACCPGVCQTQMGGRHATKTAEQGAQLPVDLALLPPGLTGPSGAFLADA